MKKTITFISLLFFLSSCASPAPGPVATAVPTQTQALIPTATATPQPVLTVVDEKAEISAIYDENGDPTYVLQDDVWVAAELNAHGLLQARASDNRIVFWNFESREWEPAINWRSADLTEIAGPNNFRYGDEGELEIRDRDYKFRKVVSVNENGTLNIYHDATEAYYIVEREALGMAEVNGLGARLIATVDMPGNGPVGKIMLIPEVSTFVTPIDFKDASAMNMDMDYLHFATDVGIMERSGLLQVSERLVNVEGRELYYTTGAGVWINFHSIYIGFANKQPIPKVDPGSIDDPFEVVGVGKWSESSNASSGNFTVNAVKLDNGQILVFVNNFTDYWTKDLGGGRTLFNDLVAKDLNGFGARVGIRLHIWGICGETAMLDNPSNTMPTACSLSSGNQRNDEWFLVSNFPDESIIDRFFNDWRTTQQIPFDFKDVKTIRSVREIARRLNVPVQAR